MKVTLLGASGGEVSGSAYLLQTARSNVLIDCGLFQGAKRLENSNRLPNREVLQRMAPRRSASRAGSCPCVPRLTSSAG